MSGSKSSLSFNHRQRVARQESPAKGRERQHRRLRWEPLHGPAVSRVMPMPDDRQKCLQAGASDYLTKLIDVEKPLSSRRGASR